MSEHKICINCFAPLNDDDKTCLICKHNNDIKINHEPFLGDGMTILDRYVIGSYIKQNDNFLVYKGFDLNINESVIIKEFFPNNIVIREERSLKCKDKNNHILYKNLFSECKEFYEALKNVDSNNIEKIYNSFQYNGTYYIIFKEYNYKSLETYLSEDNKKIGWKTAIKIINDISLAIEKIHSKGLTHGHINSSNICFDEHGNILVKDFLVLNNKKSMLSMSNVEKSFLAPEQLSIHDNQGTFTDVYALACIYVRMVTGKMCNILTIFPKEGLTLDLSDFDKNIDENVKRAITNAVKVDINARTNSILMFLKEINKGINYDLDNTPKTKNRYSLKWNKNKNIDSESLDEFEEDEKNKILNIKSFGIVIFASIVLTIATLSLISYHLIFNS